MRTSFCSPQICSVFYKKVKKYIDKAFGLWYYKLVKIFGGLLYEGN